MSDAKKPRISVPLPAFGDFCPYIPSFSSTLLHCRNILSLLQRHIGLSNMRFALSIDHDWRRHQAETINPPLAGLQEEGVRAWALHLMPSDDQWHCHSPATHPWSLRTYLAMDWEGVGLKMECGDWQKSQGEPMTDSKAKPGAEERGREGYREAALYCLWVICSW